MPIAPISSGVESETLRAIFEKINRPEWQRFALSLINSSENLRVSEKCPQFSIFESVLNQRDRKLWRRLSDHRFGHIPVFP
jgi:hypothetical protein